MILSLWDVRTWHFFTDVTYNVAASNELKIKLTLPYSVFVELQSEYFLYRHLSHRIILIDLIISIICNLHRCNTSLLDTSKPELVNCFYNAVIYWQRRNKSILFVPSMCTYLSSVIALANNKLFSNKWKWFVISVEKRRCAWIRVVLGTVGHKLKAAL